MMWVSTGGWALARAGSGVRRSGPGWGQFLHSQPEAILALDLLTVDLLDGTKASVLAAIEHACAMPKSACRADLLAYAQHSCSSVSSTVQWPGCSAGSCSCAQRRRQGCRDPGAAARGRDLAPAGRTAQAGLGWPGGARGLSQAATL